MWNLKVCESGLSFKPSRRTDSGTEQSAPALTLTVTARNQRAFIAVYSFGLPDSALGKPIAV